MSEEPDWGRAIGWRSGYDYQAAAALRLKQAREARDIWYERYRGERVREYQREARGRWLDAKVAVEIARRDLVIAKLLARRVMSSLGPDTPPDWCPLRGAVTLVAGPRRET